VTLWDWVIGISAVWLVLYYGTKPYPPPNVHMGRRSREKAALLTRKKDCCSDVETCAALNRCMFGRPLHGKGFVAIEALEGEAPEAEVKDCKVITLPVKVPKERETFEWTDSEETE